MAKDLTTSEISRQNILNNPVALPRIRETLDIKPLEFNGQFVLTKQMVADFYEVDVRTIERQLVANEEELAAFLNIGMLLTTSEKAKQVRGMILDIVIAVINEKTGGGTKYINRRDREYLPAAT